MLPSFSPDIFPTLRFALTSVLLVTKKKEPFFFFFFFFFSVKLMGLLGSAYWFSPHHRTYFPLNSPCPVITIHSWLPTGCQARETQLPTRWALQQLGKALRSEPCPKVIPSSYSLPSSIFTPLAWLISSWPFSRSSYSHQTETYLIISLDSLRLVFKVLLLYTYLGNWLSPSYLPLVCFSTCRSAVS